MKAAAGLSALASPVAAQLRERPAVPSAAAMLAASPALETVPTAAVAARGLMARAPPPPESQRRPWQKDPLRLCTPGRPARTAWFGPGEILQPLALAPTRTMRSVLHGLEHRPQRWTSGLAPDEGIHPRDRSSAGRAAAASAPIADCSTPARSGRAAIDLVPQAGDRRPVLPHCPVVERQRQRLRVGEPLALLRASVQQREVVKLPARGSGKRWMPHLDSLVLDQFRVIATPERRQPRRPWPRQARWAAPAALAVVVRALTAPATPPSRSWRARGAPCD